MLYNKVLNATSDETGITEPVTLQEAKDFCRIDIGDDDDLIEMFITAARKECEDYVGLSFVKREWTAHISNPNGGIFLPYGPIDGESVTLYDADGDEMQPEDYELSGGEFIQVLEPWDERMKAVYDGGYEVLPLHFKRAILSQILWLNEHRDTADVDMSPVAKKLLKPYRRVV